MNSSIQKRHSRNVFGIMHEAIVEFQNMGKLGPSFTEVSAKLELLHQNRPKTNKQHTKKTEEWNIFYTY